MKQYWADAATTNCVWLLQVRRIPSCGYVEVDEEDDFYDEDTLEENEDGDKFYINSEIDDDECWHTVMVSLFRGEVFNEACRRHYNYGKEDKDWRIYGVPCIGAMPELLGIMGKVGQEYVDMEVEKYNTDRKEWREKLGDKIK